MLFTHPLSTDPLPDSIRLLPADIRAHINALAGGVVTGLLSHRPPETLAAWGFSEYVAPPAPEPEPTPTDPRIVALRNAYVEATRQLCQLAQAADPAVTVADKLEDYEYAAIRALAYSVNVAGAAMCTDTLLYCLFALKGLDGQDAWERIEYQA